MVFGEWMFASGCLEGCSVERRWLLQDLQVCVLLSTQEKEMSPWHNVFSEDSI